MISPFAARQKISLLYFNSLNDGYYVRTEMLYNACLYTRFSRFAISSVKHRKKDLQEQVLFSTKSVLADGRNPHFVRVKSLRGEIPLRGAKNGFNFTLRLSGVRPVFFGHRVYCPYRGSS